MSCQDSIINNNLLPERSLHRTIAKYENEK